MCSKIMDICTYMKIFTVFQEPCFILCKMLHSENDDATNKVGSNIWMGSQIIVLKLNLCKEGRNYKEGKKLLGVKAVVK